MLKTFLWLDVSFGLLVGMLARQHGFETGLLVGLAAFDLPILLILAVAVGIRIEKEKRNRS